MTNWIKCSERMPDKIEEYLVVKNFNGIRFIDVVPFLDKFKNHITHWMPLPPFPEEEK